MMSREYPQRIDLNVRDGIVIVASDAHFWPGRPSTAFRGLVKITKELKSQIRAKVMNGDAFDGATISRHASIGWEGRPSVAQELEVCRERLEEWHDAAPDAEDIWDLGNHDMRFETKLADSVPEYKFVPGVHLRDHFPAWRPAWSTWINKGQVVLKHRFKGGKHAAYNNALHSGVTIVSSHDHMLKATPITDYRGLRWGVSTGTLAENYGPQFRDYTEDNPVDWQPGFVLLHFAGGILLPPELVFVLDKHHIGFRNRMVRV